MELDDGRIVTQSNAIAMYCAAEAGLLPSDPAELARTTELQYALEEVCYPFPCLLLDIAYMRLALGTALERTI